VKEKFDLKIQILDREVATVLLNAHKVRPQNNYSTCKNPVTKSGSLNKR